MKPRNHLAGKPMTEKQKPIRSFVRRQGRISAAQKKALETQWTVHGVDLPETPMDFIKIFQRQAPLVFEIGFGMGEALLELAEKYPENNYLGVDVHAPGIGAVLMGVAKKNLHNVKVFNADAIDVLNQAIPNESLTGVHVFFPDPWHKKRHHKRRLVNDNFAALIHAKLKRDGYIHLATDWQNYAEQMLLVMSNHAGFINAAGSQHFIPRPETRPLTRFEQRGERLGHGVWDLLFVKI